MVPDNASSSRANFAMSGHVTGQSADNCAFNRKRGAVTADVCRKHGISEATFYKYKAKFGGMEVSDARKLKALEDENAKLKKLLAETMLDNAILKDVASKKW